MKLYQQKLRILAAQIMQIAKHPTDPTYILLTDAESVVVSPEWISHYSPEVGGHVVLTGPDLQASYMTAEQLAVNFQLLGMVALEQQAPAAEQAPEAPQQVADEPMAYPDESAGTTEAPRTFTFDEFVEHGRAQRTEAELVGDARMPWHFDFFGRPVTHESDDCYLIMAQPGRHDVRFNRGELLTVEADNSLTITEAAQ